MSNEKMLALRTRLEKSETSLAEVAADGVRVPKIIKQVMLAASNNPDIATKCSQGSVVKSVMKAAALGLDCSGVTGQAHLVPYKTTCQLIVGYQGLLEVARRSKQIASLDAQVVRENDEYLFQLGDDPRLDHRPVLSNRGPMVAVYAIAWLREAEKPIIEIMNREDVEAIKKRSATGGKGPWTTDFEEMARKTVLRRICKRLPSSVDLQKALADDDDRIAEAVARQAMARVTTETLMKPPEKQIAPGPGDEDLEEESAEEEPRKLSPAQTKQLESMAENAGVSWDEIEGRNGQPLEEGWAADGDPMVEIPRWIKELSA